MHLVAVLTTITAATCYFWQCTAYRCAGRGSRPCLADKAIARGGRTTSPALRLRADDESNKDGDMTSPFAAPDVAGAKRSMFTGIFSSDDNSSQSQTNGDFFSDNKSKFSGLITYGSIAFTVLFTVTIVSQFAHSAELAQVPARAVLAKAAADSASIFDPANFQPVCPTSDKVYQLLKVTANSLVGSANVVEYGPLIASVLLRVRLELCVLESFLYEAVVPFIRTKGLSWVLPLHETVESFLAGTIFALASNFILLGSTKIIAVLFIYADALTGFPARLLGSGIKKAARSNKPLDLVGSGIKVYGDVLGTSRKLIENIDTFVGRYLVIATTAYIAFKFLHYKVFNDVF